MCERTPACTCFKSLKVSFSQQEEMRKRSWKRRSRRERNMTSLTMLSAGFILKNLQFIRHVSGDFLPHGPICSVHLNAAWVKNRLMVYSPDTRAASGTYMKHASAGGGTHTAPRSACCRAAPAPDMSGGIWRKKKNLCKELVSKFGAAPKNIILNGFLEALRRQQS